MSYQAFVYDPALTLSEFRTKYRSQACCSSSFQVETKNLNPIVVDFLERSLDVHCSTTVLGAGTSSVRKLITVHGMGLSLECAMFALEVVSRLELSSEVL